MAISHLNATMAKMLHSSWKQLEIITVMAFSVKEGTDPASVLHIILLIQTLAYRICKERNIWLWDLKTVYWFLFYFFVENSWYELVMITVHDSEWKTYKCPNKIRPHLALKNVIKTKQSHIFCCLHFDVTVSF